MYSEITKDMQNWKKLLIMDPLLNSLFDPSLPIKDFLHQQILTLHHEQIICIYSKLSSVKHAISKQIQKEVQTKHQLIEASFLSKHQVSTQLKLQNQSQVQNTLKNLQEFNHNYSHVKDNITKLENINKIIRFSKGLEKFKINCRLLKTFMKDYNSANKQDDTQSNLSTSSRSLPSVNTSANESLNLPKVSKLLKQLNDLMGKHDFTGIKYFENEKNFINNSRDALYTLTDKQLIKLLSKYLELISEEIKTNSKRDNAMQEKMKSLEEDIKQKFKVLNSINKLKEFVPGYCKKILVTTSDILKTLFETYSIQSFHEYFVSTVFVTVLSNAKILMRLEEILTVSMLSRHLINANLPNLFEKYIQRLVSYFTNLINWNLDQDTKETQKRKLSTKMIENSLSEVLVEMKEIAQTKNSKLKVLLVYKYPILYSGLSLLVNKIHEQVLLKADYNKGQYEFYAKKSQIMNTLVPISKKFYSKFDQLINFSKDKEESVQKQMLKLLNWFYCKIIGIQPNKSSIDSIKKGGNVHGLSLLIKSLNEKLLKELEKFISQENSQSQGSQTLDDSTKKIIRDLVVMIDRKQALKNYSELQRVIDHIKRIKQIKSIISDNRQQPLTGVQTTSSTEPILN